MFISIVIMMMFSRCHRLNQNVSGGLDADLLEWIRCWTDVTEVS